MREQFGELVHLGDYLEVRSVEHPNPDRRGRYRFAEINRTTGTVRDKGDQTVAYAPSKLWVVQEGDLLVSGIDVVHGAVAVAGADVDGCVMSTEMYAYKVKDPRKASAIYLQLLLRTQGARQLLEGMTTGTSNRTRLESAEQLLELPMPPLPPRAEQLKTAKAFERSITAGREAREARDEAEGEAAAAWHFEILPDETSTDDFETFEDLASQVMQESKSDG
jgi:hypothetical protein